MGIETDASGRPRAPQVKIETLAKNQDINGGENTVYASGRSIIVPTGVLWETRIKDQGIRAHTKNQGSGTLACDTEPPTVIQPVEATLRGVQSWHNEWSQRRRKRMSRGALGMSLLVTELEKFWADGVLGIMHIRVAGYDPQSRLNLYLMNPLKYNGDLRLRIDPEQMRSPIGPLTDSMGCDILYSPNFLEGTDAISFEPVTDTNSSI